MPLSSAFEAPAGLTERMPTMMMGTMRPSALVGALFEVEDEAGLPDVLLGEDALVVESEVLVAPAAAGGEPKRNMRKKFRGAWVWVGFPCSSLVV